MTNQLTRCLSVIAEAIEDQRLRLSETPAENVDRILYALVELEKIKRRLVTGDVALTDERRN